MAQKKEQEYRTEMLACPPTLLPPDGKAAVSLLHPDIIAKNYCCGLRFPPLLEDLRVLSLGCGFVRDCFVLSKLIGQQGEVVGTDPSSQVISFAEGFLDSQRQACSYQRSNVSLVQCEPHKLMTAGLKEDQFDLICFNTVLGLTPKKRETMEQLASVLKTGGEVLFTEMMADARVPAHVKKDESLWMEGIAGAYHHEELVDMARAFGFSTPRLVQSVPMRIKEPELDEFIGHIGYCMATYRMFKLPSEVKLDIPERVQLNSPQEVSPNPIKSIKFDVVTLFKNGEPINVDGELAAILHHSRYSRVLEFKALSTTDDQAIKMCPTNPFDVKTE